MSEIKDHVSSFETTSEETPPARSLASRWARLSFLVPVAALALIAFVVRIPYYVVSPGPARDVQPLIQVEGRQTFPSKGHFLLTAVSVNEANVYEAFAAWLDPAKAVVEEAAIVPPGRTEEQEIEFARSQMDTSKIDATIVALTEHAGYPDRHGPGALVEEVFAGTPADGKLFPGDVILSVDGERVDDPGEVGRRIVRSGEGKQLLFTVRPLGEEDTREVRIAPARIADIKRPVIGVSMVRNFPFSVSIQSGDIGGPSAGLMWTLGLIDLLTPGDLTRARIIAGTGEIAPTGEVGPIGGVEQKVQAAEEAGAKVFFAPSANVRAARSVADGILVVPVRSYVDALNYLRRLE